MSTGTEAGAMQPQATDASRHGDLEDARSLCREPGLPGTWVHTIKQMLDFWPPKWGQNLLLWF